MTPIADPPTQHVHQRIRPPLRHRPGIPRRRRRRQRRQNPINRRRIHRRHQRRQETHPIDIRPHRRIPILHRPPQPLVLLLRLHPGDELIQPTPQQLRRLMNRHLHHRRIQQLLRRRMHQPPQRPVDPHHLVLIDLPGQPGVPRIRTLRLHPPRHRQNPLRHVLRRHQRQTDLQRRELTGLEPRIGTHRRPIRDPRLVQLPTHTRELHHQLRPPRLRPAQLDLLQPQFVDQLPRQTPGRHLHFPHTKNVAQGTDSPICRLRRQNP